MGCHIKQSMSLTKNEKAGKRASVIKHLDTTRQSPLGVNN